MARDADVDHVDLTPAPRRAAALFTDIDGARSATNTTRGQPVDLKQGPPRCEAHICTAKEAVLRNSPLNSCLAYVPMHSCCTATPTLLRMTRCEATAMLRGPRTSSDRSCLLGSSEAPVSRSDLATAFYDCCCRKTPDRACFASTTIDLVD